MPDSTIHKQIESVSNEHGIPIDYLKEAISQSISYTLKKELGDKARISVYLHGQSLIIKRLWNVVSVRQANICPQTELTTAQLKDKGIKRHKIGEQCEEVIDTNSITRIYAQIGRSFIRTAIDKYKAEQSLQVLEKLVGSAVKGIITHVTTTHVEVTLLRHNVTAVMRIEDFLDKDVVSTSEYFYFLLEKVYLKSTGKVGIRLSRRHNDLTKALCRHFIEDVRSGSVEIKGSARVPGIRSKITVHSNDSSVDPCASCIGVKGKKIKLLISELGNEQIDIVEWYPDRIAYGLSALSISCNVLHTIYREHTDTLIIYIEDKDVPRMLGQNGNNIRLAHHLTGINYKIRNSTDLQEDDVAKQSKIHAYMEDFAVSEDDRELLERKTEGFALDELLGIPLHHKQIKLCNEHVTRALTTHVLQTIKDTIMPLKKITCLQGKDIEILLQHNIMSLQQLSALSASDLQEVLGVSYKVSRDIILESRKLLLHDSKQTA